MIPAYPDREFASHSVRYCPRSEVVTVWTKEQVHRRSIGMPLVAWCLSVVSKLRATGPATVRAPHPAWRPFEQRRAGRRMWHVPPSGGGGANARGGG
eukprot:2621125-Pyramimonas_sp.AAC.1